jgi:hypothetical protein
MTLPFKHVYPAPAPDKFVTHDQQTMYCIGWDEENECETYEEWKRYDERDWSGKTCSTIMEQSLRWYRQTRIPLSSILDDEKEGRQSWTNGSLWPRFDHLLHREVIFSWSAYDRPGLNFEIGELYETNRGIYEITSIVRKSGTFGVQLYGTAVQPDNTIFFTAEGWEKRKDTYIVNSEYSRGHTIIKVWSKAMAVTIARNVDIVTETLTHHGVCDEAINATKKALLVNNGDVSAWYHTVTNPGWINSLYQIIYHDFAYNYNLSGQARDDLANWYDHYSNCINPYATDYAKEKSGMPPAYWEKVFEYQSLLDYVEFEVIHDEPRYIQYAVMNNARSEVYSQMDKWLVEHNFWGLPESKLVAFDELWPQFVREYRYIIEEVGD